MTHPAIESWRSDYGGANDLQASSDGGYRGTVRTRWGDVRVFARVSLHSSTDLFFHFAGRVFRRRYLAAYSPLRLVALARMLANDAARMSAGEIRKNLQELEAQAAGIES